MKSDLHKRLCNFGRWARSYPQLLVKCGSAEHVYHNKSGQWDFETRLDNLKDPIDEVDALVVWRAVRTLPWVAQSVLKFEYIFPWIDRHIAARRSKLYHIRKFDDAVVGATFILSNLLTKI